MRTEEQLKPLTSLFLDKNGMEGSLDANNNHNALATTFSDLIDAMDIAVWHLDLDYRVIGINKKAREIYGEDALGDFCYHVAAKLNTVCEDCPAEMVYNGQESGRSEHKRTNMEGKEIYIDHIATPVKNKNDELTGSLVLIIDITCYKQQEQELAEHRNNLEKLVATRTKDLENNQAKYSALYKQSRRAEKLYRSLLNSSADAIAVYDMDGRVKYLSPSFSELFGWQLDELKGKKIPFVPEFEKESTFCEIQRLITTGEPSRNFLTKRFTKDGRLLDIYISASRYDDSDGKPGGILVILKNVTNIKVLERQLQQAQKMDALGTLAGGIAHDFNNILAAVMGFIELEYINAEPDSKTHNRMEKALAACNRARDLVKQILTFSSQEEQRRRPFRIGPVVKDTLQMMRATLPTSVDIQMDIEEEENFILGDPTQIHQILVNLCTNAGYAMRRSGGVLGIDLKHVAVDATHACDQTDLMPGSYLRLVVSDTGVGMDRQTKARIFEPFFTTKAPGEGTGIGLSVTHGIVKSHGGKIVVRSEPGKGSTFEVYIPTVKDFENHQEELPLSLPTGNERILLVDDEEIVITATTEMLNNLGYEVVAVQHGSEAIKIFHSQPDRFQLVITDQTMPGMTGMRLAEEVLRVKPDIPIILSTGFSNKDVLIKALTIGISRILSKPFVLSELALSVREILDQAH